MERETGTHGVSGDRVGKKRKERKIQSGPHRLVVGMKEKYEGRWMRENWR
jgi:hypothetical protein